MIKINLLPTEKPRSYRAYYEIVGAGILIALSILISTFYVIYLNTTIKRKEMEKREKQKTVNELKVIIDQVLQYERDKKILENKLRTIEILQKNQIAPVKLLEEVSKNVPEQIWLSYLKQTRNRIILRGSSLSLTAIGDFITALENSVMFENVKLSKANLRVYQGKEVYNFELNMNYKQI